MPTGRRRRRLCRRRSGLRPGVMLLLDEIAHGQFDDRTGLGNLFRQSIVNVWFGFWADALVQTKLREATEAGEANGDGENRVAGKTEQAGGSLGGGFGEGQPPRLLSLGA